MDRKDFLRWMGIGGAFLGGSYFWNNKKNSSPAELCSSPATASATLQNQQEGRPGYNLQPNPYGGMIHAPLYIKEDYGKRFYFPPTYSSTQNTTNIEINAYTLNHSMAHGITTEAWTFNGSVPGPILRFPQGKEITINFNNKTNEVHSLHLHGNHDPNQDGWSGISPFGDTKYLIECDPPGIHPYHCHIPPIAKHISKGLYGVLLVDPVEPRKKAHEYILIFSGWDLQNKNLNDIYTWNGIAGYYERYPIKVPVGELVRLYIVNLAEFDPVMTFHLHAKTFDIFRSGYSKVPDGHSDSVTLGPTERVILEFTLKRQGRYMFHPHESKMAERGAMGWIVGI